MIECGWCAQPSEPGRCGNCRRDPALPWLQRGQTPPPDDSHRRRLRAAISDIEASGQRATVERIAEHLDVAPRTVRRWQQMAAS